MGPLYQSWLMWGGAHSCICCELLSQLTGNWLGCLGYSPCGLLSSNKITWVRSHVTGRVSTEASHMQKHFSGLYSQHFCCPLAKTSNKAIPDSRGGERLDIFIRITQSHLPEHEYGVRVKIKSLQSSYNQSTIVSTADVAALWRVAPVGFIRVDDIFFHNHKIFFQQIDIHCLPQERISLIIRSLKFNGVSNILIFQLIFRNNVNILSTHIHLKLQKIKICTFWLYILFNCWLLIFFSWKSCNLGKKQMDISYV